MKEQLEILDRERKYLVSLVLIVFAISTGMGAFYWGSLQDAADDKVDLHKERLQFYADNNVLYDLDNVVIGVYSDEITKKIGGYHYGVQSEINSERMYSALLSYVMVVYYLFGLGMIILLGSILSKDESDIEMLKEAMALVRLFLIYILFLLGSSFVVTIFAGTAYYGLIQNLAPLSVLPLLFVALHSKLFSWKSALKNLKSLIGK